MLKPSLPVVKDTLAHIFWQMDHMATVHHHYGNNHLHHEIKKDATQNEQEETGPNSKLPEPVSIHLFLKAEYDFSSHSLLEKHFCQGLYSLQEPFPEISSPPPKC